MPKTFSWTRALSTPSQPIDSVSAGLPFPGAYDFGGLTTYKTTTGLSGPLAYQSSFP